MMRITLASWTGVESDGIMLFASGAAMRIILSGCEDATELRYRGGQWFTETGELVTIRFHRAAEQTADEMIPAYPEAAADTPAWLN